MERSPSGKVVVPSSGPLDAEIVWVGESPAKKELELGQPFVGPAGTTLDTGLRLAGIDRFASSRFINLVPVRPAGDKYVNHLAADLEWGVARALSELKALRPKLIVPLGANPLKVLTGLVPYTNKHGDRHGGINDWRGSLLRPDDSQVMGYNATFKPVVPVPMLPTYHPAAVLRQMEYHVDFIRDLKRVKQYVDGRWQYPPERKVYVNDYPAFEEIVHRTRTVSGPDAVSEGIRPWLDLIAFDTEQNPDLVSIATEHEIFVFDPTPPFVDLLRELMASPFVCKVAHNFTHDATWLRKRFDIRIVPPRMDTMGGAHILDPSLQESLSPGISSRFTAWPFHKWMEQVSETTYSGLDAAVCYDAYWPIMEAIYRTGRLADVLEHDNKLLDIFVDMTVRGFKVNVAERNVVEGELREELATKSAALDTLVQPIIEENLDRFKKPHLFGPEWHRCPCCGGGSKQCKHCLRCSGYPAFPKVRRADMAEALVPCFTCGAVGKLPTPRPFNTDSADQVADVIYRGLGIKERKFKGRRTVRIKQLEPIADLHPVVAEIISTQKVRADMETVERLTPGYDGRLHCVFNPWGTDSGRVAGSEGLIYKGTNPMNIPKAARRLIEADPGMILLYPDMEQIEARNMAVLTKDPGIWQALTEIQPEKGKPDIHLAVVKLLHSEARYDITRQQAKKLEYAAFYGIRASNLGKEMGTDTDTADRALKAFYYVFNKVPQWHAAILEEALNTRILTSPTGRIRTWEGYIYDPKEHNVSYEVAKEMWSFKPQDMAAWVLALGAIELARDHSWIELLIHVHDALVMQAELTRQEEATTIAVNVLSRTMWGMPYPAEMKVGHNWYEASA